MFTKSFPQAYRPDIDGLRALAVISVMFYHLDIPGFSGGFAGVDIFFVISGYLITRNIASEYAIKEWSFQRFYSRRARRLFPALFFTLCLSFIFAFLLLTPDHFRSFAQSLVYTSVLAPNVFFWSETGYFDIWAQFKPLLHLWSLGIEEQFYLLWPWLLIGLLKLSTRLIIPAMFAIAALSVGYGQYWLGIDAEASFYLLPFRSFEFALGALLAFSGDFRIRRPYIENTVLLAALILLVYSISIYDDDTAFPGINALIPCIGAVMVILAGRARGIGWILSNKVAVMIGLMSYSLYLIHWPLLVYYKYWVFRVLTIEEKIGIVIVSLLIALLMYRFVEQPFRYSKRRNILSHAGFASVCLALTLIIVFPATHVWALDGLRWRVNNGDELHVAHEERQFSNIKCLRQREPVCVFGTRKPGKEDMLVIGDSHSRTLWRGLDYLARQHNLKIKGWSHLGCPPIFDIEVKLYNVKKPEEFERPCNEQIQRWQQYIDKRSPKIVVLAARWTLYYESLENYGLVDHDRRKLLLDKENPIYTKSASRKVFFERLSEAADDITGNGSKLIIFSQAPELGIDPEACKNVPDYLLDQKQKERRCQFVSYEKMMARLAFTDESIRRLAKDNAKVMGVIMKNVFCDRKKPICRFFENGQPLYQDFHHLNAAGSMKVARHIEKRFKAFLRKY